MIEALFTLLLKKHLEKYGVFLRTFLWKLEGFDSGQTLQSYTKSKEIPEQYFEARSIQEAMDKVDEITRKHFPDLDWCNWATMDNYGYRCYSSVYVCKDTMKKGCRFVNLDLVVKRREEDDDIEV